MSANETPAGMGKIDRLTRFFDGSFFPVFLIATLTGFTLALTGVLFLPSEGDGLAAFARDFKVWCFGFDPETGQVEGIYVVMLLVNPLMLIGLITLVWWRPLQQVFCQRPHALAGPVAAAAALVLAAGGSLLLLGDGDSGSVATADFPAESLRTAVPAPPIELVDHTGQPFSLEDARGKVVMLTAVYASCGLACPRILAQARRVVDGLDPELADDLIVAGITLDPATDDVAMLSSMAEAQMISAPRWRLLTGPVETVESTLDILGFARSRDPETGIIDHVNLFILVDRGGRIAYRFGLGELQEAWSSQGIELLLREPGPAASSQ